MMSNETVWFEQALLPDGWARDVRVTISAGRIIEVAPGTARAGDCHAIGLPGMPNLHSHAFQRAMAGLTERRSGDDTFWSWREVMYRFVERLTPDDVEAVAALAYMEMLEGGFTRVGEFHYLHHDSDGRTFGDIAEMAARIAAAADETGIGLTLLPVFYAHSGFGGQPPSHGQRRFINDIDGYARLLDGCRKAAAALPDATVGVAPHSLRAVTPEELTAVTGMKDGPVHIHIAEQVREVEDCVAWSGARPVEWLLDHAEVGRRWCLVHATHMTGDETGRLARSDAVAGLCPVTEADLGDGVFPAADYTGAYGIGSDSNVLIGAADELRLLEYAQRLSLRKRNVLEQMYERAVAGGARALGVSAGLAAGASADMVSLDASHPALIGKIGDRVTDSYVFAAGKDAIDCVWRHGRKVVSGGRHFARQAVMRRYRAMMERLL